MTALYAGSHQSTLLGPKARIVIGYGVLRSILS